GELTPDYVTAGSGRKVWWICANGHEWQTRIANRNR
ncbi:MAG: zinc-ribbon domain-containing protein, partial [Oscillospiraceae bacterium]|nr:zinc-ribbon domain-containing protein [Oscillospiraceae bacterium]